MKIETKMQDKWTLVFQRGAKLKEDYYIVSIRENTSKAMLKFSAHEMETSEIFEASISFADFDKLFTSRPDLAGHERKEQRYDWIAERLDFSLDNEGSSKSLLLPDGWRPPQASEGEEAETDKFPCRLSLNKQVADMRTALCASFVKASKDGTLKEALAESKHKHNIISAPQDLKRLRTKATNLLLAACNDGSLEAALETANAPSLSRDISAFSDVSPRTQGYTNAFTDASPRSEKEASKTALGANKEDKDVNGNATDSWLQKPSVATWLSNSASSVESGKNTGHHKEEELRCQARQVFIKTCLDGTLQSVLNDFSPES
jgi:hypothetical protein